MHDFYLRTFADYGNTPALTLDFLRHLARAMPRQLVLVLASRDGRDIAGALCLRGLHFRTCDDQGLDYCLREGLHAFEPGAQGEHKLARGFLPSFVRSRHYIVDHGFAAALAPWCADEAEAVRRYAAALRERSPFRGDRSRLPPLPQGGSRSEEHTSELQSRENLVCR